MFANCNVRTTTCKWRVCFITVILQFTTCNFIIAFLKCNAQTLTFTVTTNKRFMAVSQLLCACGSTIVVAERMDTHSTAIKTWNIFIHSIAPSFFFTAYRCYQLSQTIQYQSEDLSQMPRKSYKKNSFTYEHPFTTLQSCGFCGLKMTVSFALKWKICHIYSSSCCSKHVWLFRFYRTQKSI